MAMMDVFLFFLAGFAIWLLYPVILGLFSERAATALGTKRWRQAIGALRRANFVLTRGGVELKASRYDEAAGEEGIKIDGSQRHFTDVDDKMTTMYNKPVGIAHQERGVITDIRDAEIGSLIAEYDSNDEFVHEVGGTAYLRNYVPLPAESRLVPLRGSLNLVDGSADPGLVMRMREIIKTMQEPYNSSQIMQYVPWLMAFGAGVGATYMVQKVSDGGGGGGVGGGLPIGMLVDVVGVVL